MSQKEQFSIGELTVDTIVGGGLDNKRKKRFLNAALGSAGYPGTSPYQPLKTLAAAYAEIDSLKDDIVVLQQSASALTLATGFDWQKHMASFIGTAGNKMNQRARIGHAVTVPTLFTVSGYGNVFANIMFSHGVAITDLTALSVTGNRNAFYNCHFLTPTFAAQGDAAGFAGVSIAATETYFKDCVFGSATMARTGAYPTVKIAPPSSHLGYTRFDNCTFLAFITSANPLHVYMDNSATGLDQTYAEFNNCRFIATSANMATAMTAVFAFATTAALGDTCGVFLDQNCQFFNCGNTIAANYSNVWIPTAAKTAAGVTTALLATVE